MPPLHGGSCTPCEFARSRLSHERKLHSFIRVATLNRIGTIVALVASARPHACHASRKMILEEDVAGNPKRVADSRSSASYKKNRKTAMLGTILLVILILMLLGTLPTWPHSRSWGYAPSGGLGLVVVIILILLLLGLI